jgi:adhesin HecA-like repeat protein
MCKNLCLAAALSCAVFGASTARAQAVISIDPTSQSVIAGTDFTVDVNISNVSNLYGYQFDLTFNPNVLEAVSSSEGTFLAQGGSTFFIPGTNDNVGGTVSATADTLLTAVNGANGSGELVAFTFDALKAGTSSLNIVNETLLDSNLNVIIDSTTSGLATVTPAVAAAPEIDPTSAASGLILLLGGIAVICGRRANNGSGDLR